MTTYHYQKLTEPDAIRLLLLEPSESLETPLSCSLLCTSLSVCHNNLIDKYTALSYVWGDPTLSQVLKVGDKAMYITQSLESALLHLRDARRSRLIWADAICINQRDNEERNQQVKQMGLVYWQAGHTMIYLGEGTFETSTFLKTLQSREAVGCFTSLSGSVKYSVKSLDIEIEDAAREWILSRPWFKRVWILQELVLSQDPLIQCGTSFARWSSFHSHISKVETKRSLKPAEKIGQDMGNLQLQYRLNEETKKPSFTFARRLYDLLKSRKGCGASDARDMLFANLGLVHHSTDGKDRLLSLLTVNYAKTKERVYIDLAVYLFENFPDFRMLSLLDPSERRSSGQLPSWAPDWTIESPSGYSGISNVLAYDNSKSDNRHFLWASSRRVLVCEGKWVGRVDQLTAIIDRPLSPQIARDFAHLLRRGPLSEKDLYQFLKLAFTETYQKWRDILATFIPNPARVLQMFDERIADGDSELWSLYRKYSYIDEWPLDPITDRQEYLVAEELRRIVISLCQYLRTLGVNRQILCESSWNWNWDWKWLSFNINIQSMMMQLVLSSLVTKGPNLFFSRRLARLDNNLIALVPGATNINDTISMPLLLQTSHPIPLVLRTCRTNKKGLDKEIGEQLKERQTFFGDDTAIKHHTVVGECLVQEWMYHHSLAQNQPYQILAIH